VRTSCLVTNHDTDGNPGEYLGHQDGARFILANEWLLASGYGSPQIYSSFEWETGDGLTPARSNGLITDADCSSDAWTCDHRNRGIVAMVKWHNYVGNAKRANFYTDDANVIAFSKDSKGWAAFNNGTADKQIHVRPACRQAHIATSSMTRIQVWATPDRRLSWTAAVSQRSLWAQRTP
jgi:alpha-amylase